MRFHLFWLLTISTLASAELYKCTDASGSVTYQAIPGGDLSEEIIEIQPAPVISNRNDKAHGQAV